MSLISLIHPSRSRPKKAYETARMWIDKSGLDVSRIDYVLSLDKSDPLLSDYYLESYRVEGDYEQINDNKSVVEATNQAAKVAKGDILIYLSDDFVAPDKWGQSVIAEFEKYSGPTLIKVDECLQKFHIPVLTIPMMNRALYERLGYFWYPEYKSMFCDEDLYWTAQKLGALKMAPHLKFEHQHVSVGKADNDETYKRSAANWEQGKALFAKRKAAGFPL
jgi:hypothetical protein